MGKPVYKNNTANLLQDPMVRPLSLAVLNGCRMGAWEQVGGVPLIGRALFQLNKLGIRETFVLVSSQRGPLELARWQGELSLRYVRLEGDIASTILDVGAADKGPVLYLDAAHLVDSRLIKALALSSKTTLLFIDSRDREKGRIRAGRFSRGDFHIWAESGAAFLIRNSRHLFPEDIDPFCPEIRGIVRPFFLEVHSKDDAKKATRVLIRSMQKKVMDLPAEFIDPYFEDTLTLLLCKTPITPNMVTIAGLAIAMALAYLFWHAHFVAGALGTYLVEVLDGVDGKLARTKLQFTKFGEYEGLIDYFYENTWYVAIGVGLSRTVSGPLPALLAGLLVLSDTLDNIWYTLADKWYGKSIDLFSRFDAAFRRIAGRRNIYGFMFIIGFSLGYPLKTFFVAAGWAAVTATVHAFRLIRYGKSVKEL